MKENDRIEAEKMLKIADKQDFVAVREVHQLEVRDMVLDGHGQVKEGRTKDFNEVCDRLEQKYKDMFITDLQRAEKCADREGWIESGDLEKEMVNRIDDAIYESEQEMLNGEEMLDADIVFAELEKKYFG